MTEILKPDLVWIEGRCYRSSDNFVTEQSFQEHDLYEGDDDMIMSNEDGNYSDEDIEITKIDDNRFSTSFHVAKHYLGYVIGKKGAIRSRIERDTRTEIKIPRHGHDGDIVIVGSSLSNVKAARRRINMIVVSSRMKQRATHFLSIPMNNPQIQERYNDFKDEVLREFSARGIDSTIFAYPMKLHLTIGMLCLMDNEERVLASKLLTEAKDKIVMPLLEDCRPLKIRMKGVSYMNDDPTAVHVLYAAVQNPQLQRLADQLCDFFHCAGLMKKENIGCVKLHVTVMNSRHRGRNPDLQDESSLGQPRESFDASKILDRFADYDFGEAELTEIHLSQLGSSDSAAYYSSTCVITC